MSAPTPQPAHMPRDLALEFSHHRGMQTYRVRIDIDGRVWLDTPDRWVQVGEVAMGHLRVAEIDAHICAEAYLKRQSAALPQRGEKCADSGCWSQAEAESDFCRAHGVSRLVAVVEATYSPQSAALVNGVTTIEYQWGVRYSDGDWSTCDWCHDETTAWEKAERTQGEVVRRVVGPPEPVTR